MEPNDKEIIIQLRARIEELEQAMYDHAQSSLNVIKYFARK